MVRNNKFERNILQRITALETKMDEIKDNHLPHIEERLDKIQGVVWKASGGIIVIIILADIALRVFF